MNISRTIYLISVLVIMLLVGVYVRAGVDRTETPQVTGPVITHPVAGRENCLACHGNITESHNAMFGPGNYNNCLNCHAEQ
ncbi:MAG: hypothetical protein KGZ63_13375 [Clostridiales bacterium]|jgi:hypothetical protein|nr:hypothetical protein [Clostridiales bacterium]